MALQSDQTHGTVAPGDASQEPEPHRISLSIPTHHLEIFSRRYEEAISPTQQNQLRYLQPNQDPAAEAVTVLGKLKEDVNGAFGGSTIGLGPREDGAEHSELLLHLRDNDGGE